MPVGVIINAVSLALGGLLGTFWGKGLSEDFKEKLNMVLGICSMGMGISSIVLMENMPAVVFSLIIGTAAGLWLRLGQKVTSGAAWLAGQVPGSTADSNRTAALVTVIVLFCASGTGIYGAIVSGMTGNHSILIAKSVLDLFTALIFACDLGIVVSAVAVPQIVIFLLLFLCAGWIFPMTTPSMVADFKACGGFIMLATGFRMLKLKMFPIADMVPAMLLVMPVSWCWVTWIMPLLAALAG